MVKMRMALRLMPTMRAPVSSWETARMARPMRVVRMKIQKARMTTMESRKANSRSREMKTSMMETGGPDQ